MAQKTLVNGTAYEITGGRTLVDGTGYSIPGGRTLIDGTGYSVSFSTPCTVAMSGSGWSTSGSMCYTHLIHNGTNYTSGTIEANVGDTVTVKFYAISSAHELSVKLNGNWVYGSGSWEGVTGSTTYDIVLTGDATFTIEVNGSYASSYTNVIITMDE